MCFRAHLSAKRKPLLTQQSENMRNRKNSKNSTNREHCKVLIFIIYHPYNILEKTMHQRTWDITELRSLTWLLKWSGSCYIVCRMFHLNLLWDGLPLESNFIVSTTSLCSRIRTKLVKGSDLVGYVQYYPGHLNHASNFTCFSCVFSWLRSVWRPSKELRNFFWPLVLNTKFFWSKVQHQLFQILFQCKLVVD